MKKKVIAIVLSCMLVGTCLSGCGSKAGETESGAAFAGEEAGAADAGEDAAEAETEDAGETDETAQAAEAEGARKEYDESEYVPVDWFCP